MPKFEVELKVMRPFRAMVTVEADDELSAATKAQAVAVQDTVRWLGANDIDSQYAVISVQSIEDDRSAASK